MREEKLERLKSYNKDLHDTEFLIYKYYIKDLLQAFDNYAKGKLLDIGCGNKPYKDYLSNKISEYVGCDIIQSSEECVDIISPANNIPLESEIFDTVISTQTIEHVEDHQGLLSEAYRLLKPGGSLIISGPMYWPLHEEPYDFFRFTKHGFNYILNKSGFVDIKTFNNGGKWALCGQVIIQTFYPDIEKVKSFKGKIFRMILRMLGGVKGINKFFSYMDDKSKDEKNTMNLVLVAKK